MDERTKTIDGIVRNKAGGEQWAWGAVSAAYDAGASAGQSRGAWQPMRTAPQDGTAVLVLLEDSDVPHPVRWVDDGWRMTWDDHDLTAGDGPRYWMACPADPDAKGPNAAAQGLGAAQPWQVPCSSLLERLPKKRHELRTHPLGHPRPCRDVPMRHKRHHQQLKSGRRALASA